MGKKAKKPDAPDYVALAKQQAADQQALLQQQTVANRANQTNQYGSLTWEQDPTTGQWTQTQTLRPELQQAFDSALGLQQQGLDRISGMGEFSGGPALPTYDQNAGEEYGKMFTQQLLARVTPQQAVDRQQMETKLRLQGLQPGTEAYNRAYQNLLTSQGDVTAQAQLQGLLAGGQEARNIYNTELAGQQQGYGQAMQNYLLPWQTAQMSQGLANSVMNPQFGNYNTAGQGQAADIYGASKDQYAQQMQAYNEAKASKQGKGSSIGSVVGAVGGSFFGMPQVGAALGGAAGGALASDERLKEDILPLSDEQCYERARNLIPIKWRWTGTSVQDLGISAQQVAEEFPELVNRGQRGMLNVNYTALFAILLGAFRHLAAKEAINGRAAA